MSTLGIIGSGVMGTVIARLAVGNGIPVVMSNSRAPRASPTSSRTWARWPPPVPSNRPPGPASSS